MKTYFIHQDGQSSGPFSIGELRQRKITANTPVWSEGMDGWESAKDVADLQFLFKSTPPPIVKPEPLQGLVEVANDEPKSSKKEKSNIWGYIAFVILISCGIAIFTYQQIRITELEDTLTEQKDSLKDVQRVAEDRRTEIDEMKQEEVMRQKEEHRISVEKQIGELNAQLQAEQIKLEKINGFQLLRSSEEKEQQVTAQQNIINSLEQKIEALKQEKAGSE